jgi:hypothetical protein
MENVTFYLGELDFREKFPKLCVALVDTQDNDV